MWDYLPEDRRDEYAATDEEAATWVEALSDGRTTDARRPPELSTRDNVARAIYTEVREGRGSPHGGVFLDISYLPADHVRRKLPSMYEQFKELADVDITAGPMEVGPTTHYIMGGIRVDAETGATTAPGPVRRRRGRGRDARREPARRQLAVGPARVRAADGRGRRGARRDARRTSPGSTRPRSSRRWPSCPRRSPRTTARARTGSTRSSRRRCSRRSASSGRPRTSTRRSTPLDDAADPLAVGAGVARWPRLQPRLEPRLRGPQHADRVRGDRPQRAPAEGEPRRPQPARLPGPRREVGASGTASSGSAPTAWRSTPRSSRRCPTSSAA